ncbi:pre-RNA processing PIH1/Nop17-domain-containing protein [Absidia repens]|uniref:Pre-RNA processing PIH1/Nop17-domain-containing protein n=1 Tax=Absidia repens TaxID=90262 RepID=A0A1X2I0H7_9FUNG|nr:pre-RNA processing PIH1/Nop17-domain-containing protein [Absidia repens]
MTQYLNPAPKNAENAITIQPQPGYACKTRIESRRIPVKQSSYASASTVYINVCHSDRMPAPALATDAEIQAAMVAAPDATYRIPLSLGLPRQVKDDGSSCEGVIMDACIHTQPFVRSEHDLDFRLYVLELALEHAEDALGVNLSREFSILRLPAKGMPIPTRIIHVPKAPGSFDAFISSKVDENHYQTSGSITPITKTQPAWSFSPSFQQENGILTVVLQMPSSGSPATWKTEISSSHLILHGVTKDKAIDIKLPSTIDASSLSNQVTYYKISKHLVVNLAISDVRQRYI